MNTPPPGHSILWGSHESDTRILWDEAAKQATVWGNLGPMPVSDATRQSCESLAASWNLEVFDHEPA